MLDVPAGKVGQNLSQLCDAVTPKTFGFLPDIQRCFLIWMFQGNHFVVTLMLKTEGFRSNSILKIAEVLSYFTADWPTY